MKTQFQTDQERLRQLCEDNTKLRKVVDAALSCWPDADHMPTPEQLAAFFKALREAR
jgi:hypothetical protein